LLRNILSSLAEFEADNISERVKSVTEVKVREGRYLGGPRPFGYDYGNEAGSLVVNESEAAVVRRIFREFNDGRSQRQLARDLNAEGIRTATGREWRQNRIGDVLARTFYKAVIEHEGECFAANWPAIVSAEEFDRAAERRTLRAARPQGGSKREHLLIGGLLRCGHCEGNPAMRTITYPGGKGVYRS
jgi:hypothetical protein